MADLESYVAEVLDPQDKELLREASGSLKAGALRLAYVGVWIAIAEGLRRKFAELSNRDPEAAKHLREIEDKEANHKAVDAPLVQKAKDYGFISDAERMRLIHIYENRNVFGHPYSERPTETLIDAAASEAVSIVLGKPTRLRHGYLSDQVHRITYEHIFLDDSAPAVETYAVGLHQRSTPALHLWFLQKLWNACEPLFADQSLDIFHRRCQLVTETLIREDPTVLDGWEDVDDLSQYPEILGRVFVSPDLFDLLSDQAKDMVIGKAIMDAPTNSGALANVFILQMRGDLTVRQAERLEGAMKVASLSERAAAGVPVGASVHKLIEDLSSHNWYTQNPAADLLRTAGPGGLRGVSNEDLRELGRNISQAADGTAGGAVRLVEVIPSRQDWPIEFITGILLEPLVHEDREVRLKSNHRAEILRTLLAVPEVERGAVVATVVEEIEASELRSPEVFARKRDDFCELIRSVATEDGMGDIGRVAEAIEEVDVGSV